MIERHSTLGPAYHEQVDAKKTVRCRRVLIVTEVFNIAVNDFDAKKPTGRQVPVVTLLILSGTQCKLHVEIFIVIMGRIFLFANHRNMSSFYVMTVAGI